jgi:adenine-specific DNA-methyltransferase
MTLLERIRQRLEAFGQSRDLTLMTKLFCEDLGWGEPRGFTQRRLQLPSPLSCEVQAVPVAQMSGLPVYCVEWSQERLPGVTARRAVQRALSPLSTEHVVCYLTQDGRQLAFTWARRRSDGKIELRTLPYEVGSPARTTIERLAKMAFSLNELGPTGQPLHHRRHRQAEPSLSVSKQLPSSFLTTIDVHFRRPTASDCSLQLPPQQQFRGGPAVGARLRPATA